MEFNLLAGDILLGFAQQTFVTACPIVRGDPGLYLALEGASRRRSKDYAWSLDQGVAWLRRSLRAICEGGQGPELIAGAPAAG